MTQSVRLEIPVLLPGVEDDQDACVARLVSLLESRRGIERIHITHGFEETGSHDVGAHPKGVAQSPAQLCIHYEAERISIKRIVDIATSAGVTITTRYAHEVFPFRAVAAEDGGRTIEENLRSLAGVTGASVNTAAQVARVEFDITKITRTAILARLQESGARVSEAVRTASTSSNEPTWYVRNRELAWSLMAGSLTLAAWLFGRVPDYRTVSIALYAGAYVFGARDNVGHLFAGLRRGKFHFNIDLLMVVAAVGAAVLGEWAEGALLLFLFSLGHALEHYALGRARGAIKALAQLAPETATLRRDGQDEVVPIADVQPGNLVVVKPAERIAVDGVVREGTSAVNQAPITGESVPVDKKAADQVFAGTVNGEGVLVVEVTSAVGDRTLDRVIKLVAEAETQKAPTQQFTDRFERVFVPVVLIADVLLVVVPSVTGLWTWSESFYRAMALLVAASPCALALGTPAAILAGIAQAARNGVLIKGGAYLEALGSIEVLALDKTGTITKGEPSVTDIVPNDGVDERTLLTAAVGVEQHSQHPLARAIVRAASERSLNVPDATDVQSITGKGIRATVDGATVEVGRVALFDEAGNLPLESIRKTVQALESRGRTTMVVRTSGGTTEWLGVIGLADEIRPDVRKTLEALKTAGIRRVVMLTGDNEDAARSISNAVGIDDVRAGLMPEDKVSAIRSLSEHGQVAMVGDGVNDAPALAHAAVGIAMGGAGTAAALETADIALMGDDIARLPFAIGLSRKTRAVIRQNLCFSLAVIGILAGCTVAGITRIGPAVIAHEGSTLIVIANALRLLRYRLAV